MEIRIREIDRKCLWRQIDRSRPNQKTTTDAEPGECVVETMSDCAWEQAHPQATPNDLYSGISRQTPVGACHHPNAENSINNFLVSQIISDSMPLNPNNVGAILEIKTGN